jgi:hypothetical protein
MTIDIATFLAAVGMLFVVAIPSHPSRRRR